MLKRNLRRNRRGFAAMQWMLIAAVIGTSYGLVVARAQRDEARRAAENAEAVRQLLLGVLASPP